MYWVSCPPEGLFCPHFLCACVPVCTPCTMYHACLCAPQRSPWYVEVMPRGEVWQLNGSLFQCLLRWVHCCGAMQRWRACTPRPCAVYSHSLVCRAHAAMTRSSCMVTVGRWPWCARRPLACKHAAPSLLSPFPFPLSLPGGDSCVVSCDYCSGSLLSWS